MVKIYTEVVQSKLTRSQFESLVLHCHKHKKKVSVFLREVIGDKIEGNEW